MIQMMCSSIEFLLANIERDIAPVELAKSGLKPISSAEHLTLARGYSLM